MLSNLCIYSSIKPIFLVYLRSSTKSTFLAETRGLWFPLWKEPQCMGERSCWPGLSPARLGLDLDPNSSSLSGPIRYSRAKHEQVAYLARLHEPSSSSWSTAAPSKARKFSERSACPVTVLSRSVDRAGALARARARARRVNLKSRLRPS